MLVVIDTETTGLAHAANPPREDAIVQVGIAYRDAHGFIRTLESLVRCEERFLEAGRADEALRINHITKEQVRNADDPETVATWLTDYLLELYGDVEGGRHGWGDREEMFLSSYNVPFDQPLLIVPPWNLGRGSGALGSNDPPLWTKCLMAEAMEVIPQRTGAGRLPLYMACAAAGIRQGAAHSAAADAHDALLLHEWIVRRK